jgi:hypothetical protein
VSDQEPFPWLCQKCGKRFADPDLLGEPLTCPEPCNGVLDMIPAAPWETALRARIATLEETLRFYADDSEFPDGGVRARAALNPPKEAK